MQILDEQIANKEETVRILEEKLEIEKGLIMELKMKRESRIDQDKLKVTIVNGLPCNFVTYEMVEGGNFKTKIVGKENLRRKVWMYTC